MENKDQNNIEIESIWEFKKKLNKIGNTDYHRDENEIHWSNNKRRS